MQNASQISNIELKTKTENFLKLSRRQETQFKMATEFSASVQLINVFCHWDL